MRMDVSEDTVVFRGQIASIIKNADYTEEVKINCFMTFVPDCILGKTYDIYLVPREVNI